ERDEREMTLSQALRQLQDSRRSCFTRRFPGRTDMKPITQALCCFIVLIIATAGCGPKKPPPSKPSPQPATAQQVQTIREAYSRAYPDSRVGVVTVTLKHANGHFVAVGEVSAAD